MDRVSDFQKLKLKVASEIVWSSQAAVAFSRAFYVEDILLDKIDRETTEIINEKLRMQNDLLAFLGELQRTTAWDTDTCESRTHRILDALQNKEQFIKLFQIKIIEAKTRRQTKTLKLESMSCRDLMVEFESMSFEELEQVRVPEFSCFIAESDFGALEELNEEWNALKKNISKDIQLYIAEMHTVRREAYLYANSWKPKNEETMARRLTLSGSEVPPRMKSQGLLRKFSSLWSLRNGKPATIPE